MLFRASHEIVLIIGTEWVIQRQSVSGVHWNISENSLMWDRSIALVNNGKR